MVLAYNPVSRCIVTRIGYNGEWGVVPPLPAPHRGGGRGHVTDADGQGDRIVVVAYTGENVSSGRAAFAPDGKTIAYILDGRIYMKEIP